MPRGGIGHRHQFGITPQAMGSSQQIIAGLALLAVVVSVAGKPTSENNPLQPADLPKELVKLTEDAPKQPGAQEEKKPDQQALFTEDTALVALLPDKLPGKESDVPVVIADLPGPEPVLVVQDAQTGRFLARMARTHLPAEARDAAGEEYPLSAPVNDPDTLEQASRMMSRALPERQEEENVAKKLRRQRVLFRDGPVVDARSADETRKIVAPESGIQHSPVTHSYEVREPGRETIVLAKPAASLHTDTEEKPKLQLIRHIHQTQYAIPFVNPGQPQQKLQQGISLYPPVFNSKPAGNSESITGYFPFVNDPAMGYSTGLAQLVTDVFEYGQAAPVTCAGKHRTARRKRAVGEPEVGTTAESPVETTVMPEPREVGNLAGPMVQSITREEDEDKVQTTIVLGENGDDEDDEDEEAEDALDDEDEEEESTPNVPSKGGFRKKLKDKLKEIEKKVRKRVKNTQQSLNGVRKQVNKHVTEIVMHSEGGGLEEAGPIVSKLVVRRGGVAIAGPGGIATAGFGGTAIVGPGGTAYTSPDSLAVAGPGARVISVPSAKLQEMFDSFRKQNGRNIEAFKPSWLGTIPPDGKLVATGPVVFFNPPEQVVPGFNLS